MLRKIIFILLIKNTFEENKIVNRFNVQENMNVGDTTYRKLNNKGKFKCLFECNKNKSCLTILLNEADNNCYLFDKFFSSHEKNNSNGSILFEKKVLVPTYFWSFESLDSFLENSNASLTTDRFNKPLSALNLNHGYVRVPDGVYFDGGPFTVMAWVYVKTMNYQQRLIDFSNGKQNNIISFGISSSSTNGPLIELYSQTLTQIISSTSLALNEWNHLACVFNGTHVHLFINGTLVKYGLSEKPVNVIRQMNYIGKSSWPADALTDAIIDDLAIYNIALDDSQIKQNL